LNIDTAFDEGKLEGEIKGKVEEKVETAKKMKQKGYLVADITGLSIKKNEQL